MIKDIRPLFLILFYVFISCTSGHVKIKPAPQDDGYELCPVCKGTGVMEVYSSRPPRKGLDLNEKEKGCADSIGCLSFFGYGLIQQNEKPKDFGFDDSGRIKDERYYMNDHRYDAVKSNEPVDQSSVKVKIKCERCNGMGWIKKYRDPEKTMEREQSIEGFQRANELLDGRKLK